MSVRAIGIRLISIPQVLGPTLMLLEGKIDPALFDQNLKAMTDLTKEPALSGANAVWEGRNHFYLGLLQHDEKRVALGLKVLEREIAVGEGGGGILEDFSLPKRERVHRTALHRWLSIEQHVHGQASHDNLGKAFALIEVTSGLINTD